MFDGPTVSDAVQRLKTVFLEIPGTQLTPEQASTLAGLEVATCRIILEALEDAHFLTRARGELFVRRASDNPFA